MAINEVFPNPTVSQVIFQIRFPNLFYLESRIGEFQIKVMRDFPKSSLALSRKIILVEGEKYAESVKRQEEGQETAKIWNFESESGIELHVKTDSLDLSSKLHKTYNNKSVANRFRDSIQKAVDALLEIAPIPIISRIGLRYIDDCPVPALENEAYHRFYNSTLALDRFNIVDAVEITHLARVRRGRHFVRVIESLNCSSDKPQLNLDYDGYSMNIESTAYLSVTDELHDLLITEFEQSLREPVFEFMRKPRS